MLHKPSGIGVAITLVVTDPDNPHRTQVYHPKTYADGVYIDNSKKHTVLDHIDDKLDHYHLNRRFRELLSTNGGLVKLNEDGVIPGEQINPSCIVLYVEFSNITDLIISNTFDPVVDYGRLVLVNDVSGDPRIINHSPRWGIYRLIGDNPRDLMSYQIIITEAEFDRVADWEDFSDLFRSTVEEIDKAVRDSHSHDNKTVLDKFIEYNGDLYYRGFKISYRDDFQSIVITTDPEMRDVMPRDIAFYITDTRDKTIYPEVEPITPFKTLSGNCDNMYSGNDELTEGPKLKMNMVTSAIGFFANCINMTSIPWYSTNNIIKGDRMFKGCIKLQAIPALSFTSMTSAEEFAAGSGIRTKGDIIAPILSNGKAMLKDCTRLSNLGKVFAPLARDMSYFLYNAYLLKELKSEIDISNCLDASHMFELCVNLKHVDKLISPKVTNMNSTFKGCRELVDIAYINFTSVTDATDTFDGCVNLKRVNVKPESITTSISFANTKLDINNIRLIIKGLGVTNNATIDFSNTPGARYLTDNEISSLIVRGWTVKR